VCTGLWCRTKEIGWTAYAENGLLSSSYIDTNLSGLVRCFMLAFYAPNNRGYTKYTKLLTSTWFRYFGESILNLIVPDKQLAALAGSYLRVLIFGL